MRLVPVRAVTRSLAMSAQSTSGGAAFGGSVGIIGGGIAGLSCASRLESLGVKCTVYDTGKKGVGGRASSRTMADVSHGVDHAAQFFVATTPSFQQQVDDWMSAGVVAEWPSERVGRVSASASASASADQAAGEFEFVPFDDGTPRYIGSPTRGLGSVAAAMAASLATPPETDVWVSPSNGLKRNADGTWDVRVNGKVIGNHDACVIAHNGKCAERITSKTPAKAVNRLLR